MIMLSRRATLGTIFAALAAPLSRADAAPVFLHNEGCGCCHKWADHMAAAGLPVTLEATDDLAGAHNKLGLAEAYHTCHVGVIGGYVISGHVPAADIKRLLAEKPSALGLVVPGMPVGSPGMEYENQTEPYEVLLVNADGTAKPFAQYGA